MKVDGLNELVAKLHSLKKTAIDKTVVVGFSQRYALIVHEDLSANHKPGKSAKYLEIPAKRLAAELGALVTKVVLKTGDVAQGLLMAGLRLQRESQKIVPIDTSALKASAFTAFEENYPAAAAQAFATSESVRLAERKRK